MWKTSFTIFFILTTAISAMLFWQWNVYSKQDESSNNRVLERAHQTITIESKKESLNVTQTITWLTNGKEYSVVIPESVSKWSCLKKDDEECESKDENPFTFRVDNGQFTFKLKVPINEGEKSFLLNEWEVNIPDVKMTKTSIEIVDYSRREGTWVTGLPLKGMNELDLIDHYVFEGSSSATSLYWQSRPLFLIHNQQDLSYYSKNKAQEINSFKSLKTLKGIPSLSIVMTDQYSETNGNGLIISKPSIKEKTLERKIIRAYFNTKFERLPIEESWLVDVFTSIVIKQESKSVKGNKVINELKNKLDKDTFNKFIQQVINEEQPINPESLDQLLEDLYGKGTHFFKLNKNESTKFIPLYFYENRKVVINEKEHKDIELIYKEEQKLFPFIETMTALGFEVKVLSDKETLLLSKGNNSYRFFLNQNIFIYNEEDYGLLENPLINLHGQIYIDFRWLHTLFKISMDETEESIVLTLPEE
ncbi:hypothetical protein SM124_02810 [Bacillus sp. 31A1R]|uniref:Copper amine oxidase-like N-terminal domain-containing protein n=1 Tax=Robertmurraya mangrovi TaxID=3098077 RepID=A0ABU5IU59_9BACI|nr:stalk domain-containing protein [Bacillus sp. 31A1R]MDZ5470674.1 hypothetical protein [Bacillus sp. 31A1R]